jgi:Uma2 family endonuclease
MEAIFDIPNPTDETQDEKMSSLNHSDLQTRLGFLLMTAYRQQYSIYTELDFGFASGKTRPDFCIMPKRKANWLADEIVLHEAPLTTIEILSPEQSLNQLTERIYNRYFPAGVKTVRLVVPTVQTVSILLPERKQIVFSQGIITDPVTNIQLNLSDIFEE